MEVGETFTDFFVLRRKELRTTRSGMPYLHLEFGDQSGRLSGNIWDDAELVYDSLTEGDIVKLRGQIETYQGQKQIAVKQLRRAKADEITDPTAFLPITDSDPQDNFQRLRRLLASVKNRHLHQLIAAFFDDEEFSNKFIKAPGGKLWHHNKIGGLVEHTLGVCRLCRILARAYPAANRDLLLTGAALHDIGKVEEFTYETFIEYSDRGRLVGHITLGAQWVAQRAAQIEEFPADVLDQVMHLVLSHQADYGSGIQPATREAFLLHYADQIDSKMDALQRINKDLPAEERWTFVNLLERHLYFENREDKK